MRGVGGDVGDPCSARFCRYVCDDVNTFLCPSAKPNLTYSTLNQPEKGGARSELYYTAQIAVTCSQITVQTTSVF